MGNVGMELLRLNEDGSVAETSFRELCPYPFRSFTGEPG